jgi:signal transduction histidine kinase
MTARRPPGPRRPRLPAAHRDGRDGRQAREAEDAGVPTSSDHRRLRLGRLESIAALAGGVTHELSNLAASVVMSVELLEPSCRGAEDREVLASLEELARRLQHAGRQLHWLARGVAGKPTTFQPQYLIADVQKLASVAFPADVAFITRYPDDLWALSGEPLLVFQLLLALCLEARARLPRGGTLILAAYNRAEAPPATLSPPATVPPPGTPGILAPRYVVVEALAESTQPMGPGSRRAAKAAQRAAAGAGAVTEALGKGRDPERPRGMRAYLPAAPVAE